MISLQQRLQAMTSQNFTVEGNQGNLFKAKGQTNRTTNTLESVAEDKSEAAKQSS